MPQPAARSGCPGVPVCPLYVLAHDGRLCDLTCVDDLAKPCRVQRGRVTYDGMLQRAIRETFRRTRQRLGLKS